MEDEIKEILEALKPHDKEFAKAGIKEYSLVLSVKEQKILLDYITNLQDENKELKVENEKLTQLWLSSQEKRRKAIKYLEQPNRDNFDYSKAQLLNILQGSDKE